MRTTSWNYSDMHMKETFQKLVWYSARNIMYIQSSENLQITTVLNSFENVHINSHSHLECP